MAHSEHSIISGQSAPGDGRGRALGFPTANITPDAGTVVPKPGVYAAWVRLNEEGSDRAAAPRGEPRWWRAAVHVGPRPTFNDTTATIEVHLLNFPDRDLYGRYFTVRLVKYLRGIKKFESTAALSDALAQDCQQAQKELQGN